MDALKTPKTASNQQIWYDILLSL